MQVSVSGKHLDVGDALRGRVIAELSAIVEKYFGTGIDATVGFERVRHFYRCQISVHFGRDMLAQSHAEATEAHGAFDMAADRMATRLRRHKRRLRDRHRDSATAAESGAPDPYPAAHYVIAAESPENPEIGEENKEIGEHVPAVIAEMESEIPRLTVAAAVMRLDLADLTALLFRNDAHGGLNMVYRRHDGNVGWVDPLGNSSSVRQS